MFQKNLCTFVRRNKVVVSMRYRKCIILLVILLGLQGCKQHEWVDWKVQNTLWLEHNRSQSSVQTTTTGLQYKQVGSVVNPTEPRPNSTSTVSVDYTAKLINGYVIDEGQGVSLSLVAVISGFAEGLKMMHVHDDYEFYIPYYLAYGSDGYGTEGSSSYIPPYSTLIYQVHLAGM